MVTFRYCRYDFVGRSPWMDSLGMGPVGDCAGPLMQSLEREDVQLCERHWLQIEGSGRRVLVRQLEGGPGRVR